MSQRAGTKPEDNLKWKGGRARAALAGRFRFHPRHLRHGARRTCSRDSIRGTAAVHAHRRVRGRLPVEIQAKRCMQPLPPERTVARRQASVAVGHRRLPSVTLPCARLLLHPLGMMRSSVPSVRPVSSIGRVAWPWRWSDPLDVQRFCPSFGRLCL